jgi:hypothetical protein
MAAWRRYHDVARLRGDKDEQPANQTRMNAAQSTMIFETMKSAGLQMSEGDIQTEAYVSQGFVERDHLYIEPLRALPELAGAMKTQVEYTRQMVERIAQR